MQKKIIALAVAGLMSGAAFAQSNVTIYGRVDVGYLNSDTDSTSAAGVKTSSDLSTTGFAAGALTTSRIGFRGTEDLGNGLKANFNLEYALGNTAKLGADTGADLATPFATRLATVGLSGNWGSFDLGRQVQAIEMAWAVGSAGAQNNAVGSLYGDTRLTDARADELITYTSPMFSGFQIKAQYGKGETDEDAATKAARFASATLTKQIEHSRFGLGATYTNGPLNVAVGYSKENQDTLTAAAVTTDFDKKQWTLAANYDFGIAKAFGMYTSGTDDDAAGLGANQIDKRRGWEMGVNVPVGPVVLIGSFYKAKTNYDATAVLTDADHNGYQLAALYPLSKRTIAYGMYGHTKTDYSLNPMKTDTNQFAVGLRHDF